MHRWGDEGVDWKGISEAARYIGSGLRKWGRVTVLDYKEKYGTVRVYCVFGWSQIHSAVYPGYAYSQFPKWLWVLDCRLGYHLMRPLNWVVVPIQKRMYRRYYAAAVRKWPHLRSEILDAADFSELLEGI